jgi:hypothetical protein
MLTDALGRFRKASTGLHVRSDRRTQVARRGEAAAGHAGPLWWLAGDVSR